MQTVLALALGATCGALLRYYATVGLVHWLGSAFPYGTLLVNVVGCFFLGAFLTYAATPQGGALLGPQARVLVATGFCGSLTTFSTFGYDTVVLLEQGRLWAASANVLGSLLLGGLAVVLGIWLVRTLLPG